MNNCAYAEKTGKEYSLFLFSTDEQIDFSHNFQALMMSRMDFDVKFLELPPIPDKEIGGLLKYRIRSLYPGRPEESVLDYRILVVNKKEYAVLFLSQKSTLNEYRKIAGGRPLFLPFVLIQSFLKKYSLQDIIFLFWHRFWIEILIFQENKAPVSFVLERSSNISLDLNQVKKAIPGDNGKFRVILLCPDREKEFLKAQVGGLTEGDEGFKIHSIQETLGKIKRKTEFLFEQKKGKILVHQKVRLQILIAVVLFMCVFIFKRSVDQKERYFNDLRNYLGSLEKQTSRIISLQNEIDELQEKMNILKEKRPIDTYHILSELSSILKPGTRIQSFILERSFFQIEAVGPNPLELMEVFKTKALFENVKLVQIVPIKDSDKELFKITGRVNVE